MSRTFASLRYYNYRVWFAAALVANVGTWMQRIAQDWLVLTVLSDDSGIAVGLVTALQFLPVIALSPWAGVLADRLPRRRLLMVTQGAMGVLALGLGALVLSGAVELWHVYVFATLLGVVTAFDNPVRQTFVAEMVPAEKLPNAVGLNSASFNAARLVGPGVSGLLIAAVGPGWSFVLNGVTFAATIGALALMRTAELQGMASAGRAKGQIREGLRYVRTRTDVVVTMVVMGVVSAFGVNFQLTSAMMARVEFGKGAGEYGVLGSILAVGSLTGALLAARRERPRVRLVIGAAFAFSVALGVMAVMPTYELYALMCVPVGLASLTMMTAANSTIQVSVDPAMRGRVMSLYMVVFLGSTPVGAPIVGWIGEAWGPRWSIGIGAITGVLVTVAAALWASRSWNLKVRYRVLQRPHLQVRYLDAAPAVEAPARAKARDRIAVDDAEHAVRSA
ncbi:MFS transporter [Cellulosimicrobium arenosum]|uniref:MFS transporter n=1 Tax=Cellulosimicrobium arenosum TaxID=2708133 RepID=A0A927G9C8_9MICO|nr:MFS transporter [Cellulosimicrobium arenosum]MBD8079040.1 MFS transporter [Cellulosimicrobium arenosum]